MGRKSLACADDMKQGQTVYVSSLDIGSMSCSVESVFLYSHKVKLPPKGVIITQLPVSRARQLCSKNRVKFYRKRSGAQRQVELDNKIWSVNHERS